MKLERSSGVLAHPTSFPGPHGVGDLGQGAYEFVDWLALAGQTYWQLMPLSPVGYGNSPYAATSAFAGNPLLISIDGLAFLGLDTGGDSRGYGEYEVDFASATAYKSAALRHAYDSFARSAGAALQADFEAFRREHESWLEDYALFVALKDRFRGSSWQEWPDDLRLRSPLALAAARSDLREAIEFHAFVQFLFAVQWQALKRHANVRGIRIIGDIPIYVALDSSDVWANRPLFRLDVDGRPIVVTGVPPDLFTEDGQLWGNPMFDWNRMEADGFRWWIERVRRLLQLVDVVRIDHFRGLAAGWVVPATDSTARNGWWEQAPGGALFQAIRHELGELPIIVEDLGIITRDVEELRTSLELPGMKVLQFAFDGQSDNPYLPHMYDRRCVVYTGTHDNQTTVGWFHSCSESQRTQVRTYLGTDGSDISWDFIRLALASVADLAVVPLQDIMRLGDDARMNRPGVAFGNWTWRYQAHQLHDGLARGLRELTSVYGRVPQPPRERGSDPYDYTISGTEHPLVVRSPSHPDR